MCIALVILTGGCCAPVSDRSTAFNVGSLDQSRAVAALNRVNFFAKVSARAVVEPGDRPSAWSWTDGTVCVSWGFVERTSDEELTAVLAHELGHLCLARDGAPAAARFGFRGNDSIAVEHQADEVAVRLLKQAGLGPDSLVHALEIVRNARETTIETKQAIDLRMDLLREHN